MSRETLASKLRQAAKMAGLKTYFTGQPCCRGHICERRVSTTTCVECSKYHKRRPETRQKDRDYYHATADARKERRAAYNKKNSAIITAKAVKWQRDNPEKRRQIRKKWAQANKEKLLIKDRNRKAKKQAAEGTHSTADIQFIRAAQGDKCAYCRQRLRGKYHVDHIVALANGGSNRRSNLQITCASCNTSKGAKDPIDFAQSRGRLL